MRRTQATAGHSTSSTGRSCSRVTKGLPDLSPRARPMMPRQAPIMRTASQKGKNPLLGPSVPQPMPMRSESQITSAPPAINTSAVVRSAARMSYLLLQQAALFHQVVMRLVLRFHPRGQLRAGEPRRLERTIFQVRLEFRRVHDALEKRLVPHHRFLGHGGGAEDAPEHEIGDVGI